jgi:DNA repair photolyase
VRWQHLEVEQEEGTRLPGYREPAVVRRFDAPEALDVRFYEVRARSVLNRVPERSAVPFRWTINPYRGCTHACAYCLAGDTPILLPDGRTRALADLGVGDAVVGTERRGAARRCVITQVLAHWSTTRPAHRVTLEDGTQLIASADHRFLTLEGWRHVAADRQGAAGRPTLAPGSQLLGTGAFSRAPDQGPGRRPGHLCGLIGGDGSLGSQPRPRGARRRRDGIASSGSRGGLVEQLGPVPATRPVVGGRGGVEGRAVTSSPGTRVVSVEPLGTVMRLFDITTGTGDFIADGVVSHNCFARPTHTFLDFDAGRDFEREIVVKVNAPEVALAELSRRSWGREHVAMGTNTDPYQWVEGRYRLMPGIWEAMAETRTPCSILTKSPLLLRDLPILLRVADVTTVTANLSVPTLDEKAWRATEPHTPSPRARLEAVAELNGAGIPTGVLVAPLMPGINDGPEQVEPILDAAEAAGATSVGGIGLHLRGEVREVFFGWLREQRPDLVERYERLYARGAYLPKAERERLAQLLRRPGRPAPARFLRRSSPAPRPGEGGGGAASPPAQGTLF